MVVAVQIPGRFFILILTSFKQMNWELESTFFFMFRTCSVEAVSLCDDCHVYGRRAWAARNRKCKIKMQNMEIGIKM